MIAIDCKPLAVATVAVTFNGTARALIKDGWMLAAFVVLAATGLLVAWLLWRNK